MPIAIADSTNAMLDRIESVLQANLAGFCSSRETAEYPLPAPSDTKYMVGQDRLDVAYQHLGAPNEWVAIQYGDARLVDKGSGDTGFESYIQITPVSVSVVMKRPGGVDLPNRNGRKLLMSEWMLRRGELYRGCLIDVLTDYVMQPNSAFINHVDLTQTGVSSPIETDSGIYREAIVYVDVHQDVEVRRP